MNDAEFRKLVEEVRERTDLAVLIGEKVELAQAGSVLKGRSPWNSDTTPSFVVWPHTQTWRDFSGGGSNGGGDCFDYLQRRDGGPFMAALKTLAARAGVDVPGSAADDPLVIAELERISERRRVETLLTAAATYYHGVLPSKLREEQFKKHYGLTDETIDTLQLGWADGHLFEAMTEQMGISREEALSTGLFVQFGDGRIKDFFESRLVFPYWLRGKVVYFIARATEHTGEEPWEQAKYKKLLTHSDRHPYVSKYVANDTLYNEDAARGAEEILITEGVTDCISAMQAGVACLSPVTVRFRNRDHEKLLALTARAKRVIICNDSEVSGAGEAGALETAQALYAAGRDVRLATLPRPESKDKLDVNELVSAQGPEALHKVLKAAVRLPEFLLGRIPADTPKADLQSALEPVLAMLRTAGPVERDACLDVLSKRFDLKRSTLKELLRGPKPPAPEPVKSVEALDLLKDEVFEEADHYYIVDGEGHRLAISTFHVEPRELIQVETGEIVVGDVTTQVGRTLEQVRFLPDAWLGRRNFLKSFPSLSMQWMGTDDHVQGVLKLLASRKIPTRKGTLNLGYLDTDQGPRWVGRDGVLVPEGAEAAEDEVRFVPSGATLAQRIRYRPVDRATEVATAAKVLPLLLELNTPEVILPVLGWFFAAPLKPRIQKLINHFPILMVWGTHGSGKSTLIMEVFWPLMGVESAEPYSCTETEFALLKLFSATNSVPVFIDEYKYDMPRQRKNTLHRLLRRIYCGEVEERGRADQTLASYPLSAPLCLAGETRPTEAAIVERLLTSNPNKDELTRVLSRKQAFAAIHAANLGHLTVGLLRFLMGRDTAADLALAQKVTASLLGQREVPQRVWDNLMVMVLGLHHFEEYAAHLGVKLPELDVESVFKALLGDVLEGERTAVKSGLDLFLEELSLMAVKGELQHGREYVYRGEQLALHFPSCHATFTEHCRRVGYEGEVPDRKALRRQFDECFARKGYVKALDVPVCFNGRQDRRRAALIDLEEVKKTLVVDDFPREAWGIPCREPERYQEH